MDFNPSQILLLALATVRTMLTVLIGFLINNSRLGGLRSHIDSRFDDMRATWHSELRRSALLSIIQNLPLQPRQSRPL